MGWTDSYLARIGALSDAQKGIVREVAEGLQRKETRPLRALAAAGSGKTATVVCAIAYVVNEQLIDPKDVMLTTFTKAGAQEMEHRLKQIMPEGKVGGSAGVRVGTYHALALRKVFGGMRRHRFLQKPHQWNYALNLDSSAKERGSAGARARLDLPPEIMRTVQYIDLDDLWDRIAYTGEIPGIDAGVDPVGKKYKNFVLDAKDLARSVEVLRSYGVSTPDEAVDKGFADPEGDPEIKPILYGWDIYNVVKEALSAWDFGDALQAYHDLVVARGDSAKLVIVDEGQDNTRLQMAIPRHLVANARDGRVMYVGDVRQCQPPDTEVRVPTPRGGFKTRRLGDLQDGDEVVAWSRTGAHVFASRGFKIKTSVRDYAGAMATVQAGDVETRCTPEHRWLVKWDPANVDDLSCVYVMRKNGAFRVGWCKVIDQSRGLTMKHYGTRARIEGADALWIIRTFRDRSEASLYESEISARYGIPTAMFMSADESGLYPQKALDAFWERMRAVSANGFAELLADARAQPLGSQPLLGDRPIWVAGGSTGRQTVFEIAAANFCDGMLVPVDKRDGGYDWQPVKVTWDHYVGPVHSLDVDEHHSYVADGLCTLNSIYAFRGAQPDILGKADQTENAMTLELTTNYRSASKIVEAGNLICAEQDWSVGSPAVPFRADEGRIDYIRGMSEFDRAVIAAREIRENMDHGMSPGAVAILSRTRSAMAPFEVALLAANVPAKIQGGSPFFRSKAIRQLMGYIRIAMGCGPEAVLKDDFRNIVRRMGDVTGAPFRVKKDTWEEVWAEAGLDNPTNMLGSLQDWLYQEERKRRKTMFWGRNGEEMAAAFQSVLDGIEVVVRSQSEGDAPGQTVSRLAEYLGELKVINLPKLDVKDSQGDSGEQLVPAEGAPAEPEPTTPGEAVTEAQGEGDSDRDMVGALMEIAGIEHGQGVGSIQDLCDISVRTGGDKAIAEDSDSTGRAVRDAENVPRVIVGTIHSSKGLEWPTVYLLAGGSDMPGRGEDTPEERRLFYVAVTRAADRLVFLGNATDRKKSWSPYVELVWPQEVEVAVEKFEAEAEAIDASREAEARAEPAVPSPVVVEAVAPLDPTTPLERDYLAMRDIIARENASLLPLFDSMREAVIQRMGVVRREHELAQRELMPEPEPIEHVEPPTGVQAENGEEPPEEHQFEPEPESEPIDDGTPLPPLAGVYEPRKDVCYIQVRNARWGNVTYGGTLGTEKAQVMAGTPVVCIDKDGIVHLDRVTSDGMQVVRTWPNTRVAQPETIPILERMTTELLRRIPHELHESAHLVALYAVTCGQPFTISKGKIVGTATTPNAYTRPIQIAVDKGWITVKGDAYTWRV